MATRLWRDATRSACRGCPRSSVPSSNQLPADWPPSLTAGHVARADGAWRLYAFADASGLQLHALMEFLAQSPHSPLRRFTPKGADIDSVIDLRAVFQQGRRELKVGELPAALVPCKGRFGLVDYEKAFSPDLKNGADIFDLRHIDRQQGALVIVRPDQYVAHVLPLHARDELGAFFAQFLLDCR
jgi:phenol 2-monooxygenase (NADPH)